MTNKRRRFLYFLRRKTSRAPRYPLAIHRRPRYPPPWVTAPSKDGYALGPVRVQANLKHFFERDKNVIKDAQARISNIERP